MVSMKGARRMRILYAAMKYDYGRPEDGYGFEHFNFYDSLRNMGHDVVYFDYMTLMHRYGRERMNRRLLEVARSEKPDVMVAVLFKDELDPLVLHELKTVMPTLNWFCDDHWRFDNYSRHWAPCFTWVVTTASDALPKYAALGYHHVIKSQWACNHSLYRKMGLPLRYDVTFVGQPHGNRRRVIEDLRRAGINVQVWGKGWDSGRLTQEEMINVFNQSRINLNLSNASVPVNGADASIGSGTAAPAGRMRSRMSRILDHVPFGPHVKVLGRSWLKRTGYGGDSPDSTAAEHPGSRYSEQIKGRNFEVPGCGGFLMTGRADHLDQYYENGKEMVVFDNRDDLIEKIRYYLTHEHEREEIAKAGYERTLREHTYAIRFSEVFRRMRISMDLEDYSDGAHRPGETHEVT